MSDPDRCDDEIFKNGKSVAALDARSVDAEEWVRAVAREANAKLDWHYSGGIANVLHLGDKESRDRVEKAINKLEHTLKGRIMKRYLPEEEGLYRKGVTQAPDCAIAAFFNPITQGQEFV